MRKSREELLNKILKQEMKYLKVEFFRYKRRPFLMDEVKIIAEDCREGVLGNYTYDEKEFLHIVRIDNKNLDIFIEAYYKKRRSRIDERNIFKFRDCVRHELLHGFAKETYGHIVKDLERKEGDASPIFLSLALFAGVTVNHYADGWNGSNLYNKILETNCWEEANCILLDEIFNYRDVTEKLQRKYAKDNIFLDFEFGSRWLGLDTQYIFTHYVYKENKKCGVINSYKFEIGANVEPTEVERLVNRKVKSKNSKLIFNCFYRMKGLDCKKYREYTL